MKSTYNKILIGLIYVFLPNIPCVKIEDPPDYEEAITAKYETVAASSGGDGENKRKT